MKRIFCVFSRRLILALPVLTFVASGVSANENGIFDEYTGTVNLDSCTACHNGGGATNNLNNYTIKIYKDSISSGNQLLNTSDTISKNITQTFVVELDGDNAAAGGFNLHTSTGTFAAGGDTKINNPATDFSGTAAGTQITHIDVAGGGVGLGAGGKAATNGDVSWTFDYNAPNSTSNVTFSICGNPVNGNGLSFEDTDGPSDGIPECSIYTVRLFNDAPVADNESINVTEDGTVNVTDATLLNGDSDPNGDSISITNFSQPGGLAFVTDNGSSFTYDPNDKFEALNDSEPDTDSFTYTISDGGKTATGTVTVNITGVNDAPVAANDTISVSFAGTTTELVGGATSVLENDDDPDSGQAATNTASLVNPVNPVSNGTLVFNANGTFSYTHDGSNTSSDSFTYEVSDGLESDTGTVNIIISSNTKPVASADIAAVLEGGSTIIDVLLNDTDAETPGALSVVNITNQTNGTAVVQGDNTVTFTHNDSQTTTASFQYQVFDGFLFSDLATVSITVTPVNDSPQLGTIPDQTGTENEPFTFDAGTVFSDVDDTNDGTLNGIAWSFQSGRPAGMTISSQGVIDWIPPQTEVFNQPYGPIVVRAADGGEDSSVAATSAFTITVSPPDGDLDDVADYNDVCLTVSDPSNADNDNDGTPGSDGGTNDGGDVCDLDDDNDGMPDLFEDSNGFDAFDASDADADADGDGISNLDEFNDGTNPVLANLTIDATGYLTPFSLTPLDPAKIHPQATLLTADNNGPFRPGRNSITWTASNSADNNLGSAVQTLDVRPIVSFAPGQFVAEGSTVTVQARLNGLAAVYPVTATYTVSGTADATDHNAVSGMLVFNGPDTTASFSIDIAEDTIAEGDETIIFKLSDVTNAVIGKGDTHTATIVEGNVMHQVNLRIEQNGLPVSSAFVSEGAVTVEVNVTDANTGQLHTISWSRTDNSLIPPTDFSTDRWTFTPQEGNFLIAATVSDLAGAQLSNSVSRVINIASAPPVLTTANSDGQGDDDITEGLADSDDDRVPDYLDSVDGNAGGENILPNQTVSLGSQTFVETEAGLQLRLGSTSAAAGQFGVIITDDDIKNFGSESGTAPLNADDDFEHVGGAYDFEISGLVAGSSARVVIPLEVAIPLRASYRKFHASTGWSDFVVDANNAIASAPGAQGACPQPGSDEYRTGLNYLDSCLQLTIEDGGLNDADGSANGVIKDPGSIGLRLQDPQVPVVKQGGGRIHPLLVILFGLGIPVIVTLRKKAEKH